MLITNMKSLNKTKQNIIKLLKAKYHIANHITVNFNQREKKRAYS